METTTDPKTKPESRGAQLEAARIRMEQAGAAHGKVAAEAMMAIQHANNLVSRRDDAADEMRAAEENMQVVIEGGTHVPKPGTAPTPEARVVSAETRQAAAAERDLVDQPTVGVDVGNGSAAAMVVF